MQKKYNILCLLIISFSASFSSAVMAKELESVVLKLQWLDQFQFAGYYMAQERGFYEDAGLRVRIEPYTQRSQDVVNTVVKGHGYYGTGRSSLVVDKVIGKPVVILAAIFQESPSVLLTRDDTGIEALSDLIGRKIMISYDALAGAEYIGMLADQGVRQHDIIHLQHSYNLDDLVNKKIDAMASYVSNEPYFLKKRDIGFRAFHPKDYSQNYYGDMLFTSKEEVTKHKERAISFRAASLKGWAYAFDHIEEAAKLIKRKYNAQNKTLESLIFEGQELKKLSVKEKIPFGHVSLDKLEKSAEAYHELGIFSDHYRLDGLVFKE